MGYAQGTVDPHMACDFDWGDVSAVSVSLLHTSVLQGVSVALSMLLFMSACSGVSAVVLCKC